MISIKTPEEIQIMAEGGKILAAIIKEVSAIVKPGVTTEELDRATEALIFKYNAKPAFKGYDNFPASLCTSVNEELVHVIPSGRVLKEGDIISLDSGVLYKGFNSDMAVTVGVGKISKENQRLIKVTKRALEVGIEKVKPGATTNDIGEAIEKYIEKEGFGVVRELCGHGIGKTVHEDPKVPNYNDKGKGTALKEGMVICIEPMTTVGDWRIKKARDNYGYQTKDGSLSAHFEHMIAVTKKGYKVLTVG
ncbi:MAG: type I methionyl aminopeptidase [Candidatus Staskawiczbacteria bacterium]|jgi:methionyl aminopeptidase